VILVFVLAKRMKFSIRFLKKVLSFKKYFVMYLNSTSETTDFLYRRHYTVHDGHTTTMSLTASDG
jgi:hypothetical protein